MTAVILLDDSPDNLRVMEMQLTSDYTVYKAEDTHEFLKILNDNKVDVAIVDYKMPTIDGKNFIDHINMLFDFINYKFPIIGITAYEDTDEEDWVASGAQGFIKRPYSLGELKGKIESVLVDFKKSGMSQN